MNESREQLLKYFASKYIWWKSAEEACRFPIRVIAQVMELGDFEDLVLLWTEYSDEELGRVLKSIDPGTLSQRSWNYWHYRLGLSEKGLVPAMPERKVG